MSKNSAEIIGLFGRTGSGKSTSVKSRLKREPKNRLVIVWDFKREYGGQGFDCSESLVELIDRIKAGRKRVAFWPSMDTNTRTDQFNIFCTLAQSIGNLLLVVEELRFVTRPSWSPEPWALITCTGRHDGIKVIATSQRPASVDKDFFGNATKLRAFSLTYPDDATVLGKAMGIPPADLQGLERGEFYESINGKAKKGKIQLKG